MQTFNDGVLAPLYPYNEREPTSRDHRANRYTPQGRRRPRKFAGITLAAT